MGQIIYREYIVFRGSNISCSLARALTKTPLSAGVGSLPSPVPARVETKNTKHSATSGRWMADGGTRGEGGRLDLLNVVPSPTPQ